MPHQTQQYGSINLQILDISSKYYIDKLFDI